MRGIFGGVCASARSGTMSRPRARVTRSSIQRRTMRTSWVHGRVGVFYAPQVGEGNEILHILSDLVVDRGAFSVRGSLILGSPCTPYP
jgi:hypothetical protein